MKWSSMFQSADGNACVLRIGFLAALLFILLNWTLVNYHNAFYKGMTDLTPFPDNAVMLVVGLGGVRVAQDYSERRFMALKKPEAIKPE